MISFNGLEKKYGDFQAVKDLNFSVQPGEMFGFLGPNGAGKTTTIRMAMGVLVPSNGSVQIDSMDCFSRRVDVKRVVGYLPDNPIFYDFMKGREILQFVAEMHGQPSDEARKNTHQLLEEFSLIEAAEEFAVNYSTGMKKKLGLACALIHKPKLLILDEPTNGLDPRASREVQNRLLKFVENGGTVFLSSHLLDMVEKLCGRIGVINRGQLVALGSIEEIKQKIQADGDIEDLFLALTDESKSDGIE